jgi:hypothetical protein
MEKSAELFQRLDGWLQKMIDLQRAKVLRLARELSPHLTPEDILNPQDSPELMADSTFNFEDGHLAGLISAQIAIRSEANRWRNEKSEA